MNDSNKWNERYLNQDTPWDMGVHHPEMERLFSHYINKGQSVLEIGCGSGSNAFWLDKAGYKVTAIDISPQAIKNAKQNNQNQTINFLVADFLKDEFNFPCFPVIFDCAVFHLLNEEQRQDFVHAVAKHCDKNGYWINISCSQDNANNIEQETGVKAPPYLTADKIIKAVEPLFEIVEMRKCDFVINRKESGISTFKAWGSVFKKRV